MGKPRIRVFRRENSGRAALSDPALDFSAMPAPGGDRPDAIHCLWMPPSGITKDFDIGCIALPPGAADSPLVIDSNQTTGIL